MFIDLLPDFPDHLGSSSYLTDFTGSPSHYYNYLPFGEEMVAQNTSSYNNVYRFSAKELDEDTGLSYFGARYYDPKFSIWLSVDPLAEKFPNFSPYNYCFQNPIKYVDPDGRAAYSPIYDSKTGKYLGVDSQGFLRGEILFMDSSKYNQLSQNGRINHNVAVNNSISISQLPSNEQGMNLFYKAVNHVSKTMDNWFYNNNPSENLFGKDIKVFSNQLGIGTKGSNPKGYSIGTIGQNDSILDDGINPDKRIDRISMNFDYRNIINTAPNIFSLFEHEFYGHGENGWRNKVGQSEDPHKKVYNFQVNTFNFRHYVNGKYKELTLKKNKAQGN